MTRDEMIRTISNYSGYTAEEEAERFLNGYSKDMDLSRFRNARFYLPESAIKKMNCFDENGNYINTESGEILLKFVKYFYENNPKLLTDFFGEFPYKYSIYKYIGLPEEFIKKDFENFEIREMSQYTYYSASDGNFYAIESMQNLWNSYPEIVKEYIENYGKLSGVAALKTGILIARKNFEQKDDREIRILEHILTSLVRQQTEHSNAKIKVKVEYMKDRAFEKYMENLNPISLNHSNKVLEENFIYVMEKKLYNSSENIFQGLKWLAINHQRKFFTRYYKNLPLNEFIEKYRFPKEFELQIILQYYLEDNGFSLKRYYDESIYRLFEKIVLEDVEKSREFTDKMLEKNNYKALYFLNFLIKSNLLTEREKKEYLKKAEELAVKKIQLMCKNKMERRDGEEISLKFLKDVKVSAEEIRKLSLTGNGTLADRIMEFLSAALMKESNVFRNIAVFLENFSMRDTYDPYVKKIFEYTETVYGNTENILEELYSAGISISSIVHGYLRYLYQYSYYSIQNDFSLKNEAGIENLAKFLKNHESVMYEGWETDIVYSDVPFLVYILYEKASIFDYAKLVILLKKGLKPAISGIERILRKREGEVRDLVEELAGKKPKVVSDTAERLIRFWDNDRIRKEMDRLDDVEDIFEYIEKKYTKNHEKNAPFKDKADYSSVRVKGSEKKIPEKVIEYYISEYMSLKDIYIIQSCRKIEEISNIGDLRAFLKSIFHIWEAEGFSIKYKNILIPFSASANESQLLFIKDKIDTLASNSKHVIAGFAVEAISVSENRQAPIIVNSLALKHKNKKVKKTATEMIKMIAQNRGMSIEELNDNLILNYGFSKEKVRFFDYGERKIKAILDTSKEIPAVLLYDETGKALKSLPKAAKKYNDDEEKVAEYKEEMKSLKKQLKEIAATQKIRMNRALMNERRWDIEKWLEIFVENPIMQQFATSLIWKKTDEAGKILQTFRYMDDGTFNTADEEECEIGASVGKNAETGNREEKYYVSLIHPSEISEEELKQWKEQLDDYEIIQSVNQLNIPVYKISEDNRSLTEITDYSDVKFYSATIKTLAKNYDFTAIIEDAGYVERYSFYSEKSNITVNLVLSEGFYVGEYSAIVKLSRIEFVKGADSYGKELAKLGDVPAGLLSLAGLMGALLKEKSINA